MAFFIAFLTFLSTLFGGFIAIKFKDRLHLVLAFASGAVIATALFELLPEIISQANQSNLLITNLLTFSAIGFLLFHIIDRGSIFHHHIGTVSASGFSIHSFFDGLGIGLGFLTNFQLGIVISLAVLAHDFSDGLNTTTVILKNKGNIKKAIFWLFIVALTPVLGVLVSQLLTPDSRLITYVLSFYFGFFLYLGASDLLPEAHHEHSSYLTIFATILGFVFIFLLTKIV